MPHSAAAEAWLSAAPGTDRQNGGDEEAGLRDVAVADRVDATVDRVEAAGPGAVGDVPPR
jgi:hypothetical protein